MLMEFVSGEWSPVAADYFIVYIVTARVTQGKKVLNVQVSAW